MFCLYVNDFKTRLGPQNIFHIFYAEDLQIYVQVSIDRICEGLLQLLNAARQVSAWAYQIGLKLNAGKTQAIIFGTSGYVQRLRAMDLPRVSLAQGTTIPFVSKLKSLGVILDSKLS